VPSEVITERNAIANEDFISSAPAGARVA
jgi:hypothetical protein